MPLANILNHQILQPVLSAHQDSNARPHKVLQSHVEQDFTPCSGKMHVPPAQLTAPAPTLMQSGLYALLATAQQHNQPRVPQNTLMDLVPPELLHGQVQARASPALKDSNVSKSGHHLANAFPATAVLRGHNIALCAKPARCVHLSTPQTTSRTAQQELGLRLVP